MPLRRVGEPEPVGMHIQQPHKGWLRRQALGDASSMVNLHPHTDLSTDLHECLGPLFSFFLFIH